MKTYIINAVKHNTRRNGTRCAAYWSIESEHSADRDWDSEISDIWFCRSLPKRLLSVLETSGADPENYGLKRGRFEMMLKDNVIIEYNEICNYSMILSLKALNK